jgi:hypothetical protein
MNAINEKLAQFKGMVTVIERLLKQKNVFISVSIERLPGIVLEIEEEALGPELKAKSIEEKDFRDIVDEISPMMLACMEDRQDSFIEGKTDALRSEEDYDADRIAEEEVLLREKMMLVDERLVDQNLKDWLLFKRSAKTPVFSGLEWDIKVKHFDSKKQPVSPLPYATCQIKYQKGFPRSPIALLFEASPADAIEIDFTLDDIEHMIKRLGVVKDKLGALVKGGKIG